MYDIKNYDFYLSKNVDELVSKEVILEPHKEQKKIPISTYRPFEDFNSVDTFLTDLSLIGVVLVVIARRAFSSLDLSKHFFNSSKSYNFSRINSKLKTLRMASGASKVSLGLLYNNDYFNDDYLEYRYSIISESIKGRELNKTDKYSPLPFNVGYYLTLFDDNNELFVNFDDPDLDPKFLFYLESIDVDTLFDFLIFFKKTPIAILSFQFKNKSEISSILELKRVIKIVTGFSLEFFIKKFTTSILSKHKNKFLWKV